MTEKKLDLLIATTNAGKEREFKSFLAALPFCLHTLKEFPEAAEVAETGLTFGENAALKAASYARAINMWSLADDSGLEVAALGGAPGVFSARWGGTKLSDAERCEKILNELGKTGDAGRRARFVCVIAIADPFGEIKYLANGVCDGKIAAKAFGTNGFGYDPIFIPNGFTQTFGELSSDIKEKISHRTDALIQITEFLKQFGEI